MHQHHSVSNHLGTGAQLDHVVEHQLVYLDVDELAVADGMYPRGGDDA